MKIIQINLILVFTLINTRFINLKCSAGKIILSDILKTTQIIIPMTVLNQQETTFILNISSFVPSLHKLGAGGKPSTWFPPKNSQSGHVRSEYAAGLIRLWRTQAHTHKYAIASRAQHLQKRAGLFADAFRIHLQETRWRRPTPPQARKAFNAYKPKALSFNRIIRQLVGK